MGLHEEVAVTHERGKVDLAVRVRERDLVIEVVHGEHARVEVEHDAARAHRHDLVRVEVAHVGGDVPPCEVARLAIATDEGKQRNLHL